MVKTVFGAAHPPNWVRIPASSTTPEHVSFTSYSLYPASFVRYYLPLICLTYAYSVSVPSSSVIILSFKQLPA